jgi:hypothetical protein
VPLTLDKSTPSSRANLRTAGDECAFLKLSGLIFAVGEGLCSTSATGAEAGAAAATGLAASSTAAGVGASSFTSAGA